MNDETFKLPRLYTSAPLQDKGVIALTPEQAHYLHTVLRRQEDSHIRIFNGQDGEWLGILQNLGKKKGDIFLEKKLIPQPNDNNKIHLLFTPIKKYRMEWLIEKAVELGVTDFHPVQSQNTQIGKIKKERLTQQILEAAEQCEALLIPNLHPLQKLEDLLSQWPKDIELLACLERCEGERLTPKTGENVAILIGPEGGFTMEEKNKIAKQATSITLGDKILRTETAVIKALSIINP